MTGKFILWNEGGIVRPFGFDSLIHDQAIRLQKENLKKEVECFLSTRGITYVVYFFLSFFNGTRFLEFLDFWRFKGPLFHR